MRQGLGDWHHATLHLTQQFFFSGFGIQRKWGSEPTASHFPAQRK
jgi:hypothetical protein